MKFKISVVLGICLVLCLLPLAMNGQEPEKHYQMYYVVEERVKPDMQAEFREAAKKWTAFMKKHDFPYPFDTYWMRDNLVCWSFPIETYADIDKITKAVNKTMEKAPEEFKKIMEGFKNTYEYYRNCVYALDYKNSVIVEDESHEDENWIGYNIYYFKPGYESEITKLLDEIHEHMTDIENPQTWYWYWGRMGTDNPVMLKAARAKNQIAFFEENAAMWKDLRASGDEFSRLVKKLMKYVWKEDYGWGWRLKELSYSPKKK